MLLQIDYIYNPIYYNVILFFIFIGISFAVGKVMKLERFSSIIGINALLLLIFVILGIIDFAFLLIAVIEIAIIIGMNRSENNVGS